MPASTSSQMQMPREPAPVAFAAERTSIEQPPRPIQPMTMEQPELSMRGGKDGGAICCGICAGLCCFECLDCCC
ncbi:hypothetical protein NXS19_009270 [Fusarium pseudograminearum]|nr:hypothetical protein FPSE5266_06176 [Fusarium pseudograminearum]UZP41454.1 hypothetical protein NXS19_009270 [Fusarium pseudograminearum]